MQILLIYLFPVVWGNCLNTELLVFLLLYTTIYTIYWRTVSNNDKFKYLPFPYIIYIVILSATCLVVSDISFLFLSLLPLYGALVVLAETFIRKLCRKYVKRNWYGKIVIYTIAITILGVLKGVTVAIETQNHGNIADEKKEILERRDYLVDKLATTPQTVLYEMPSYIGSLFQGEWALYSCSMLSSALSNISKLYPETTSENLHNIDALISIVMSSELREYDKQRWGEDPLETMQGNNSHVSYLSHLAIMICNYKIAGGGNKYDDLLSRLCETMNRRILASNSLNLQTYPGEPIYIPDMLVAIVALNHYSNLNAGKYKSTVSKWIERAKREWLDPETGLLVSFLGEKGEQLPYISVKGSYSALNCYYLTTIDEEFAFQQYCKLKSAFWKGSFISGLKEYHDSRWIYFFMLDIDAGPIVMELSPSGTAFLTGSATFFNDTEVRKEILRTSEIAGHSILWNGKRHYLLSNVALVGESIMLAMRTHCRYR